MAKKLREQRAEFKFYGEVKSNKQVTPDKDGAKPYREIVLFNKEDESEQAFRIYPSPITRTWDNGVMNTYEGVEAKNALERLTNPNYSGSENILTEFTLEGKQKVKAYNNDDFIELISKIKPKSKVLVSGTMSYNEYKGRLGFPNFNINSIKLLSAKEAKNAFDVFLPVIFTKEAKEELIFTDDIYKKLNVLVLMQTENKEKKYANVKITLNGQKVFGGDLYKAYTEKRKTEEGYYDVINKTIFANTIKSLNFTDGMVSTRLHLHLVNKSGTRPMTLSDLPSNEQDFIKAMSEIQGEDYIKEFLADKEMITVNEHNLLLQTVGCKKPQEPKEFEEVKDGEIYLYDTSSSQSSDVSQATSSVESVVSDFLEGLDEKKEDKEDVEKEEKKEELVQKDEFDELVTNAEKETKVEEKKEDLEEEDFPF